MNLGELPQEIIYEIAFYLPKRDIIILGMKMLNRQIYQGCKPYFQRMSAQNKFEQRMKNRFRRYDRRSSPLNLKLKGRVYYALGLHEQFGSYRKNKNPSADCLGPFRGDLSWLPPIEGEAPSPETHECCKSKAQTLQAQAAELGVVIPEAFLRLLRLYYLINDQVSLIKKEMQKCTLSIQDCGDGFTIHFGRFDSHDHWLYLDTNAEKGHCVLRYDDPWKTFPCVGLKYDSSIYGFELVRCDFEEWLAMEHVKWDFDRTKREKRPQELGQFALEYVRLNYSFCC